MVPDWLKATWGLLRFFLIAGVIVGLVYALLVPQPETHGWAAQEGALFLVLASVLVFRYFGKRKSSKRAPQKTHEM